ncbi:MULTISPECIES: hypothetical protein [unclassified Leptospira]|uniref:hypothetical protein n=1 Tax=unclassified Leptospira TaxID=2633828 RepID=UPI000518CF76|nr:MULTISPECIES: hypothetical protein [unclassified Leptospira]
MKINILKLSVTLVLIFQIVNCSIGTAKEACKNNLRKRDIFGPSVESCDFALVASQLTSEQSSLSPTEFEARKWTGVNYYLLNCYQYYEKLKECNTEVKKYLPAIYSKE